MKKNKTIAIILLALVAISIGLYFYNKETGSSTIDVELRDFAVEDTSQITKIFMADKNNNTVLLERKADNWFVNDKFPARADAIKVLLKTINGLAIKAPVPKAAHNSVVRNLATNSVAVEIYDRNGLIKKYYVGNTTSEQTGTYMLLEGSSVPFSIHLRGFTGFLNSRYFIDEDMWRAPVVFQCKFTDIKSVSVYHKADSVKSFKIEALQDNNYSLENLKTGEKMKRFDTIEAKFFLSGFKRLCYDDILTNMTVSVRDSLLKCEPDHIITLETKNGNKTMLEAYRKKTFPDKRSHIPTPEYDVDLMFGRINGEDLVLIQYYVFDPVLIGLDYFLTGEN